MAKNTPIVAQVNRPELRKIFNVTILVISKPLFWTHFMLKKPAKRHPQRTAQPQRAKNTTKEYKWNKSQLKWLEALESGEYKWGTGGLCKIVRNKKNEVTQERYCCLGVASDLFCTKIEKIIKSDEIQFDGDVSFVSNKVKDKLKLNSGEGTFVKELLTSKCKIHKNNETLAQLNDTGWSFKRIAKFIRDNPKAIFRS